MKAKGSLNIGRMGCVSGCNYKKTQNPKRTEYSPVSQKSNRLDIDDFQIARKREDCHVLRSTGMRAWNDDKHYHFQGSIFHSILT